jgi:hypothetical protein
MSLLMWMKFFPSFAFHIGQKQVCLAQISLSLKEKQIQLK